MKLNVWGMYRYIWNILSHARFSCMLWMHIPTHTSTCQHVIDCFIIIIQLHPAGPLESGTFAAALLHTISSTSKFTFQTVSRRFPCLAPLHHPFWRPFPEESQPQPQPQTPHRMRRRRRRGRGRGLRRCRRRGGHVRPRLDFVMKRASISGTATVMVVLILQLKTVAVGIPIEPFILSTSS